LVVLVDEMSSIIILTIKTSVAHNSPKQLGSFYHPNIMHERRGFLP